MSVKDLFEMLMAIICNENIQDKYCIASLENWMVIWGGIDL